MPSGSRQSRRLPPDTDGSQCLGNATESHRQGKGSCNFHLTSAGIIRQMANGDHDTTVFRFIGVF